MPLKKVSSKSGAVQTVNEETTYVEMGMNDNAGYRKYDDTTPGGGGQSGGSTDLPKVLSLSQPRPNPARTGLNIKYALPRQACASVKLYDITGKLVATLATGVQNPGFYSLTWNRKNAKGRSVASGVYFCTLAAEGQRFSRKVVLTE